MSLNWIPVQQDGKDNITGWRARTDADWRYNLIPQALGWCTIVINAQHHVFFLDARSQCHFVSHSAIQGWYVFPTSKDAKAAAERHQRLLVLM